MNFGERLLIARKHAKLTQKKLAKLSGVSQQTIHKLEAGKSKRTAAVVALAGACGVRVDWLSKGEGEMALSAEVDAEAIRLAKMIQSLSPDAREHLSAVVDSFAKSVKIKGNTEAA